MKPSGRFTSMTADIRCIERPIEKTSLPRLAVAVRYAVSAAKNP
jgi:hypothetical protein